MLEGIQQLLERGHLDAIRRHVGRKLVGVHALAPLQGQHVQLERLVEQAPVVGAGLHEQGEAGHLGRSVVNVQAIEVLFQDQARNVAQAVAPL